MVKMECLRDSVNGVKLSGSGHRTDGNFDYNSLTGLYESGRSVRFHDVYYKLLIGRCMELQGDWVIYGATEPETNEDGESDYENVSEITLWRNPCSRNLPVPPVGGWESCHILARGDNPKIEYIRPDMTRPTEF